MCRKIGSDKDPFARDVTGVFFFIYKIHFQRAFSHHFRVQRVFLLGLKIN